MIEAHRPAREGGMLADLAFSAALGAPALFGGVLVRGRWSEHQRLLLRTFEHQRIPPSVDESRLTGGLDLAATLSAGRAVWSAGILASGAGPLVLPSAERAGTAVVAALATFLDDAADGRANARPVIAIDEADFDNAPLDRRIEDRLAFIVRAQTLPPTLTPLPDRWHAVTVPDAFTEAIAATALALGVDTMRAGVAGFQAIRAIAALRGRDTAEASDIEAAAALVLAPRATQRPAPPPDEGEDVPPPAPPENPDTPPDTGAPPGADEMAADKIVEAVAAALPPGLLEGTSFAMTRGIMGRAGREVVATRGRPAGVRQGRPGRGVRLALTETLTAAAPWRLARGGGDRVHVRAEDLRIRRIKGKSGTLTVFCVDASGSQAYARMAEAKGAVEQVLADAYARRDQVALVAFRGEAAEVLLAPTPSLTRAKRALSALPGGGGTPLASGLEAALRLSLAALRDGITVSLLVMTDGRGNVTLSGEGGREQAGEEAKAMARRLAVLPINIVVVDTARRPGAAAKSLAEALRARYVPLPAAGAQALSTLARMPA